MFKTENAISVASIKPHSDHLLPRGNSILHKALLGIARLPRHRSALKTKQLVGVLLAHSARSWRMSHPLTATRIRVVSPGGRVAVRICLGNK